MNLLDSALFTSDLSGGLSTPLSKELSMGLKLIGALGEFQSYGTSAIYMTAQLDAYSATNGGSQTLANFTFNNWTSPAYFEIAATASTLFASRIYFNRTLPGFSGPQFLADPGNLFAGPVATEAQEQAAMLSAGSFMQARVYIGLPNTADNQVRTFGPIVNGNTSNAGTIPQNQYIGFGSNSAFVVPAGGFTPGTVIRIEVYPAGGFGFTANDDYGLFGDAFDLNNDYGTFEAGDGTTDYGSF